MPINTRKICIFLPSLDGGGAELMGVRLANSLVELGHLVSIVYWKGDRGNGSVAQHAAPGLKLRRIGGASFLSVVWYLAAHIRTSEPDAIIANLTPANVIALAAVRFLRRRPKIVVVEHNSVLLFRKQPWPNVLRRYFYKFANRVVAVSEVISSELKEEMTQAADKIVTIYNPIRDTTFEARAAESPNHEWFDDDTLKVIVAVGRLELVKSYDLLIRVFGKIAIDSNLRLILVGEGSERANLQRLIDELGLQDSVQLIGYRENALPLMANANAVVLTSKSEGLPTVLIEALLLGTPVVATNCAGETIPSLFKRAGYGELIEFGDEKALQEALLRAVKQGRQTAPKAFQEVFNGRSVGGEYLRLLGLDPSTPVEGRHLNELETGEEAPKKRRSAT